jgi:hypothetical protein
MNKNIIKDSIKYHLFIVNSQKSILLSSSNSKTELRDKGLKKIGDKINKYDGNFLYRVKLVKVPKNIIKSNEEMPVKTIGGPLMMVIEKIQIIIKPHRIQLKSLISEGNNKVYFTEKYLTKNNIINIKNIKETVYNYAHKMLKNKVFSINIIDK